MGSKLNQDPVHIYPAAIEDANYDIRFRQGLHLHGVAFSKQREYDIA